MVRVVYGKKTARSAPAVSNIFTELSPAKTPTAQLASRDQGPEDLVSQVINNLDKVKIQSDDSDSLPVRRQRKPLSRRDGNSRPTSKHGEENDAKKACSRTLAKQQSTKPEPRIKQAAGQDEVAPDRLDIPHMSSSASSSLYDLCDDYVRPLVALTNEQRIPLSFDAWSDPLIPHFKVSKIAEASYSEVYRLSLLEDHPTLSAADESVLKLVAIRPPPCRMSSKKTPAQKRREEEMSSVEDVVSEVRLLKRMTTVPGFTNYRALHILRGRPSKLFIMAWKEWNKARRTGEKSEFPDPSRKASYDEEQYWAVIEMQDAGTDVEKLIEEGEEGMSSIWAIWDVFWQTVLAVAKGESEARFEHRDLHLGNICVRWKGGVDELVVAEDFSSRKLGFANLETTIIDYTLSRAEMMPELTRPLSRPSFSLNSPDPSMSSSEAVEPEIAYNPLQNQPKIFEGDAEVEYQYEIYRYMCDIVHRSSSDTSSPWRSHQPKTNLVWLHFVLFKLCETLVWPSEHAPKRKDKKQRKALELEGVLIQVEDLLHIDRLLGDEECVLSSAAELVAVALEQGWLDQEDLNS